MTTGRRSPTSEPGPTTRAWCPSGGSASRRANMHDAGSGVRRRGRAIPEPERHERVQKPAFRQIQGSSTPRPSGCARNDQRNRARACLPDSHVCHKPDQLRGLQNLSQRTAPRLTVGFDSQPARQTARLPTARDSRKPRCDERDTDVGGRIFLIGRA